MPTRRLPYTIATRFLALYAGKTHKDMIPPPSVVPYKASTAATLDLFFPLYKAKTETLEALLLQQVSLSAQMKTVRTQAEMLITHFYEAMQNAIKRGLFLAEVRTVYGLDANNGNLPPMKSEAQVSYWGGKAIAGEAARMTLPGAVPITFPSIAEVTAIVTAFNNLNLQQAEAKTAYDNGQESIALDAVQADQLILKMWNETEAEFDTGNKPSMRRKAREWGVVYVPTPGQAPSPEDFSIMGKVTDQLTGDPIHDAELKVVETGDIFLSDEDGEYFISVLPPATYTLEITKAGFEVETITGIVVTADAIVELDIELSGVIVLQGTVHGTVKVGGIPLGGVTVSVVGYPLLTTTTNAAGQYSIANMPAMLQNLSAQRPVPPPTAPMILPVAVINGADVVLDFNF